LISLYFFLITTTDFSEEKTELIALAHSAAANIHKEIALCVLGPQKDYIHRVCRDFRRSVCPSDPVYPSMFAKILN
jgi:hypothetical protein